ncbi:alpha/beta-hydrolase [Hysterangium stoloniferum]|nr:alpha/beta-hydrolase [Hysterangium stoloniferum]
MAPTFTSDQLDLYAADDPSQPLLVYIHGGAWRSETKELHAPLADRIRKSSDYSVALLEYRLTVRKTITPESNLKHPEHAKDVLAALEYLVSWPGTAPFDSTRLYLIGHSAGGHILTSIFLDAGIDALKPSPALLSAVQGIACASGIYDLDLLLAKFPSYAFIPDAFTQPFVRWKTASYSLHHAAYPWRWNVIHSPGDTLVDFDQSDLMYDHLRKLYVQQDWDVRRISKDYTSITTEHHYVREEIFAIVVVDWVKKDQEEYPLGTQGTPKL